MISFGEISATVKLYDQMSPALVQLDRQLQQTGDEIDTFGERFKLLSESILHGVGTQLERTSERSVSLSKAMLGLAAAMPVVGSGFAFVATQLNETVANVSALLPAMDAEQLTTTTDQMTSSIQDMAIQTGKSTSDIGEGLYEVVSALGLTADSFKQLELSAKAGVAGRASTIESFKLLTAVTKTYGDTSAVAFTKVADLSFQAVNVGQTTYPELAAAIGSVAPAAQAMGVSMEELFAVMATATGVTGNTSEVATQLTSVLSGLVTPGKELEDMYKKLGVTSGAAAIKMYGLQRVLQEVTETSRKTGMSIVELLGRKEAWILTTSLAGSQAQKFTANLADMAEKAKAGGAVLEQAFGRQANGVNAVGFAWAQLQTSLKVVSEMIGNIVLPIFGAILKVFNFFVGILVDVMKALTVLAAPVRVVVMAFMALLVAIGTLVGSMGLLIKLAIVIVALFFHYSVGTVIVGLLNTALIFLGTHLGGVIGLQLVAIGTTKSLSLALGLLKNALLAVAANPLVWAATAAITLPLLAAKMLDFGDSVRGVNSPLRDATKSVGLFSGGFSLIGGALSWIATPLKEVKAEIAHTTSFFGKLGKSIAYEVSMPLRGLAALTSVIGDGFYYMYKAANTLGEGVGKSAHAFTNWSSDVTRAYNEVQEAMFAQEFLRNMSIKSGETDYAIREKLAKQLEDADITKVKEMGVVGADAGTALHYLALVSEVAAEHQKRLQKAIEDSIPYAQKWKTAVEGMSKSLESEAMAKKIQALREKAMAYAKPGTAAWEIKEAETVDRLSAAVTEATKAYEDWAIAQDKAEGGKGLEGIDDSYKAVLTQLEKFPPTAFEVQEQFKAMEAAMRMREATPENLKVWASELMRLAATGNLTAEQMKEVAWAIELVSKAGTAIGTQGLWTKDLETIRMYKELLDPVAEEIAAVAAAQERHNLAIQMVNEGLREFGDLIGGGFGEALGAVGELISGLDAAAQATDGATGKMLALKAAAEFLGAIGGTLSRSATPAIAKLGGALQGAAAGAKMGTAILPGWGTAIGAAVGAVAGFLNAGAKLRAELKKMRDAFYESFGGLDKLKEQAKTAGVALDAVFNAKDKTALTLAIDEATQKLDAFDDLLSDFDGDLKVFEATVRQAGISLQAIWDAKTAEAYLAAVKDVKRQLKDWENALQAVDDAMQRWGVTADELGPKFAQLKMDEMMAGLLKDWEVLHAAGVNYTTLVEKMGPAISAAVEQYERAGVEIPKSMKPIIDELWKQGKLVHENGKAFTQAEYEALKYGTTLTEAMMMAVEAILDLVAALSGIPRNTTTTVTTQHKNTYENVNDDGTPDRDGDPTNSFARGSDGFRNFGAGQLVTLHGVERVQTREDKDREDRDRDRRGGGGGGAAGGDGGASGGAGGPAERAVDAAIERAVKEMTKARPIAVTYTVAPQIIEDPLASKERREDMRQFTTDQIRGLVRRRDPEFILELRDALRETGGI